MVSGELGDVNEETVTAWREKLVTLVHGYFPKDITLLHGYSPKGIWNEDKTGCFFRALPDKTLANAKKVCKGGKKAKIRMTLAFFCECRWRKRNANCDRKISLPTVLQGHKRLKKCLLVSLTILMQKPGWIQ